MFIDAPTGMLIDPWAFTETFNASDASLNGSIPSEIRSLVNLGTFNPV